MSYHISKPCHRPRPRRPSLTSKVGFKFGIGNQFFFSFPSSPSLRAARAISMTSGESEQGCPLPGIVTWAARPPPSQEGGRPLRRLAAVSTRSRQVVTLDSPISAYYLRSYLPCQLASPSSCLPWSQVERAQVGREKERERETGPP